MTMTLADTAAVAVADDGNVGSGKGPRDQAARSSLDQRTTEGEHRHRTRSLTRLKWFDRFRLVGLRQNEIHAPDIARIF
ncbi:hypothetical protein [Mycobacterium persicum]|uniref:hypothetical protein n=1 Tax=Mycobacterium persicum TaxID=1487726 RepID=UPI0013C2C418|nr:hypothetical protein [Mycobacterium persicum]